MATRVYVMMNSGGRNISFRRVAFKRALVGVCSARVSCIVPEYSARVNELGQ